MFARQNPEAIDQGVFHNDVIAVGNQDLLFHHEMAFADTQSVYTQLNTALDSELQVIAVPAGAVSLEDAVRSYLFNSQLLTVPGHQGALLIVPVECREVPSVHEYLTALERESPLIAQVRFFDLRQSMNNGGGPACLRLRVVMSKQQIVETDANVLLSTSLYRQLRSCIESHYRDRLTMNDLQDPNLLNECRTALDELTQLLKIGSVYDFQRA